MNDRTKKQALKALEGMRQIVAREMVDTGRYVAPAVSNPALAASGAICGGKKHCAIGSLWVGYGVKHDRGMYGLPGIQSWMRHDFMRNRPGLKAAYEALNRSAKVFADRHGLELPGTYKAEIEDLFESQWGYGLEKRDLLRVISMAKARINSEKVN